MRGVHRGLDGLDVAPEVFAAIEERLADLKGEIDELHAADRPERIEIAWRMSDEGRTPDIADIASHRVRLGVLDAAQRVPLTSREIETIASRAGSEVAAIERAIEAIEEAADRSAA